MIEKEVAMLNKLCSTVIRFLTLEQRGFDKSRILPPDLQYAKSYVAARRKMFQLKDQDKLWELVDRIERAQFMRSSSYRYDSGRIYYMGLNKPTDADLVECQHEQTPGSYRRQLPGIAERILSTVSQFLDR